MDITTVGAYGGPPQNMPLWQIDYFKLKLLKKEPVQECSDLPLLPTPKAENKAPM